MIEKDCMDRHTVLKRNLILLSILIFVLWVVFILTTPGRQLAKKRFLEENCVLFLYSIQTSELDYFADTGKFFEIANFSDSNLIDISHYMVVSDDFYFESSIDCVVDTEGKPSFTIFAFPAETVHGLRTFAINQESKVHLWVGKLSSFVKGAVDFEDEDRWVEIEDSTDLLTTDYDY